MITDEVWHQ